VSSGIAHDLRTPLGHVRQTLESALSSPDPAAPVAQAIAQLDTVLETFAALLRIAELEHGAQRAGFAPVNLSETVAAVAGAYRPVIEDHGQTLSLDVQPDVTTSGDRALIMQVCANLLDNAVRHAGHGARIAVTLSAARRGICLTVADTGPGVPALEYQNLTRPFYRLDPSRSSPGNGLGLSLVAAIARLHGWELQFAENGPGLRVILMAGC
jgi:signal transduction histidine kinase